MPHEHEGLLDEDGVVGVYTDEDGTVVVQHDGRRTELEISSLAPNGARVERIEGGMVAQKSPTDKFRPLQVGISHSALDVTAGTVGVLVKKDGVGPYIDTNYHVAVGPTQKDREPIVQPGTYEDGDRDDKYGELAWYLDMQTDPNPLSKFFKFILNFRRRGNDKPKYDVSKSDVVKHDVALVEPTGAQVQKRIFRKQGEYPTRIESAPIGEVCMKAGRTTGITKMKKVSNDWSGRVRYPWGFVQFRDQHLYRGIDGPGSKGGDSGSTIMWDDWSAVDGRLFAGNEKENVTIGNPYKHFAENYNVELY